MFRLILLTSIFLTSNFVSGQIIEMSEPDSTQLASLNSLEMIKDDLYLMNYKADYYFEDFRNKGIGDLNMDEFIERYLDTIPGSALWSCSAFMVMNQKNEVIVGRNFDWEDIPGMILFTEPDSGYRSVSMVPIDLMINKEAKTASDNRKLLWAPYFPVEGMNERGLVVIELAVEGEKVKDENKISMLSLHLIRLLLDNATDLNESIELLSNYNNTASYRSHLFIADSTGSSAVIEYIGNEMVVSKNQNPWQIVTNNIVYKTSDKRLSKECSRYSFMSQFLSSHHNAISSVGSMKLLRNVSVNRVYSPQFNIISSTQWSVVYNIGERCIDVVSRRDFRNQYHYELKEE
jgi:hypothetical protein